MFERCVCLLYCVGKQYKRDRKEKVSVLCCVYYVLGEFCLWERGRCCRGVIVMPQYFVVLLGAYTYLIHWPVCILVSNVMDVIVIDIAYTYRNTQIRKQRHRIHTYYVHTHRE